MLNKAYDCNWNCEKRQAITRFAPYKDVWIMRCIFKKLPACLQLLPAASILCEEFTRSITASLDESALCSRGQNHIFYAPERTSQKRSQLLSRGLRTTRKAIESIIDYKLSWIESSSTKYWHIHIEEDYYVSRNLIEFDAARNLIRGLAVKLCRWSTFSPTQTWRNR